MKEHIRLGVVCGGMSSEHEVSLASAKNVLEAIDRGRFDVTEIAILKDGRWVVGEGALAYAVCGADPSLLMRDLRDVPGQILERFGLDVSG
ncbi:MAG: hypothetical protein KDD44_08905, partial [Bdellovibrionales bacterium]|nr:hypothetical protein [Bdellovibrionales bacterium]